MARAYVAIIGPDESATEANLRDAYAAGAWLALRDVVVVCGGLGGVMGAAAEGAASNSGLVVGLLPGLDRAAAHPAVTIAIPTGLGELRNGLVVRSADAVLAIGGSWGTLSEVALAMRTGVPLVSVGSPLPAELSAREAASVDDALPQVLAMAQRR